MAGNNVAWGVPIFSRAVWGRDKFTPGPFYTGRFSLPIAWASIIFLVFSTLLAMFPDGGPNPTPQSMNYTVVINISVWGGCALYYVLDARKWFTGPKTTVEELEAVTEHELPSGRKDELVDEKAAEAQGSDGETEKKSVV